MRVKYRQKVELSRTYRITWLTLSIFIFLAIVSSCSLYQMINPKLNGFHTVKIEISSIGNFDNNSFTLSRRTYPDNGIFGVSKVIDSFSNTLLPLAKAYSVEFISYQEKGTIVQLSGFAQTKLVLDGTYSYEMGSLTARVFIDGRLVQENTTTNPSNLDNTVRVLCETEEL